MRRALGLDKVFLKERVRVGLGKRGAYIREEETKLLIKKKGDWISTEKKENAGKGLKAQRYGTQWSG